jgi:predicted MFS family arabinose efflux permease
MIACPAPRTSSLARFQRSWAHPITMVLIGFVMAMTAPIELLYAIKQGLGPGLVTLFIVTSAAGLIMVDAFGIRVMTRIDARATAAVGMLLFALSEICYYVADGASALIAARALQGAASAVVAGAALQVTVRLHPRPQRALGSNQSLQLLGGAFGAPIGGVLAAQHDGLAGYRLAFAVCCGVGLGVGVLVYLLLPPLPAPAGTGRPKVSLPNLAFPRAVRLALALGLFGNYLRSGIENTAFPLVGDAAGLSPAGIGLALGLLAAVEIAVLGISGRLFELVMPARALAVALFCGVGAVAVLATAHGLTGFLVAAALFGLVDGIALAAPPVLVVAASEDPSIAVATYRIACGVGSFSGSGSVNLLIAALGSAGALGAVAAVLIGGVVLAQSVPVAEARAGRAP